MKASRPPERPGLTAAFEQLRRAEEGIWAVRPLNWQDCDDAEQTAAWHKLEAALRKVERARS